MKERMFIEIHNSADRVALEAARRVAGEGQARAYIDVYGRVYKYLLEVFTEADIED